MNVCAQLLHTGDSEGKQLSLKRGKQTTMTAKNEAKEDQMRRQCDSHGEKMM